MTGIREGLRQIIISRCLAEMSAWFEVWVPHSNYYVKEGQAVTLQCTFPKTQVWDVGAYSVSWDKLKRTGQEQDQNVYLLRDENKQWKEQDKSFRGRVSGQGIDYKMITSLVIRVNKHNSCIHF
uniref:Immunoglobulin V-set domain-containing protein n=1 Tax=Amazona collaria TaxID=241587 RepID=A0A8B9J2V7_9PSIT